MYVLTRNICARTGDPNYKILKFGQKSNWKAVIASYLLILKRFPNGKTQWDISFTAISTTTNKWSNCKISCHDEYKKIPN